jgi:hypothetical protein
VTIASAKVFVYYSTWNCIDQRGVKTGKLQSFPNHSKFNQKTKLLKSYTVEALISGCPWDVISLAVMLVML